MKKQELQAIKIKLRAFLDSIDNQTPIGELNKTELENAARLAVSRLKGNPELDIPAVAKTTCGVIGWVGDPTGVITGFIADAFTMIGKPVTKDHAEKVLSEKGIKRYNAVIPGLLPDSIKPGEHVAIVQAMYDTIKEKFGNPAKIYRPTGKEACNAIS